MADACSEAAINVNWQWNVNPWPANFPDDPYSPLDTLYQYAVFHLGANSLDFLIVGQRHNPHAQQTYRDCAQQLGIDKFMMQVVLGAPGQSCNLGEVETNVRWENDNNRNAILYSHGWWTKSDGSRNQDPLAQAGSMYWLLFGQRHNPDVQRLYRACFTSNPDGLFALVTRGAVGQSPPALLASGVDGRVWRAGGAKRDEVSWFDGVQWQSIVNLPGPAQHIAVDSEGKPWAVVADGSVLSWTGDGWERKNAPGRHALEIASASDGSVFVVDEAGAISQLRTADRTVIQRPRPGSSSGRANLLTARNGPVALMPDGSTMAWSGNSWTTQNTGFNGGPVSGVTAQFSEQSHARMMSLLPARFLKDFPKEQKLASFSLTPDGEFWATTRDNHLFRANGSAAALAVPGSDVDHAWTAVNWAWHDDGPCTRFVLCWTYINGAGIAFSDGRVGPFVQIYRDGKSAHSCIQSALDALYGNPSNPGLAVEWVMASQIHNPPEKDWLQNHPDAVIAALLRIPH
jgi:hypothetical protein